jgi:uncharacterized protein YhaN
LEECGGVAWRVGIKLSITALVVAAGFAIAACGKSDEEKAEDEACAARSDIQKQVNELSNLTLDTATVDRIKANLDAIQKDIGQIKDAEGQLNDQRKQEFRNATDSFESQVESTVKSLGSSTSISGAKSQLESSIQQLAASYQKALAPIDCGSS